jgi:hypothetical protein
MKVFVRLYASTSVQSPRHMSKSGQKVGEGSIKPPGFTTPYYFYIYSISICDFDAIQTPRAEIYIFTTGTPYKISSRILVCFLMDRHFYCRMCLSGAIPLDHQQKMALGKG